jgi:hypothetical protein
MGRLRIAKTVSPGKRGEAMGSEERSERGIPHEVEAAYAENLRRCEAAEDLNFEAFCAGRPRFTATLRVFYSREQGGSVSAGTSTGGDWLACASDLCSTVALPG